MGKSAANVIDLGSFRQRKLSEKAESPMMPASPPTPMMMPVWFWVPFWSPVLP